MHFFYKKGIVSLRKQGHVPAFSGKQYLFYKKKTALGPAAQQY
jgi:hypothetical protein